MTEVALLDLVPLLFWLALALLASFLCSLLEAVLLSVSYSYIETLIDRSPRSGRLLKELKEHTDRSLAAILTLNTVAHTLGAAGVGAEVYDLSGNNEWVAAASVVMTLLLLVFSEILPKTIGVAHWKRLAPVVAHLIRYLIFVTYPLVWALVRFSRTISANGYANEVTREEMIAVAEMGQDQGALEAREARVIRNLLTLHNIRAEDVMTPSTVLLTLHKDDTVAQVVRNHAPLHFSRLPVRDRDLDDIVGMVLRSRLMDAHTSGETDKRLAELLLPLHAVAPTTSVADLLDEFIRRREHIFLVVDEYGTTEGLVTLEDAIETLLGVEIVDESDSVDDMRQLARELWEQRREERGR